MNLENYIIIPRVIINFTAKIQNIIAADIQHTRFYKDYCYKQLITNIDSTQNTLIFII